MKNKKVKKETNRGISKWGIVIPIFIVLVISLLLFIDYNSSFKSDQDWVLGSGRELVVSEIKEETNSIKISYTETKSNKDHYVIVKNSVLEDSTYETLSSLEKGNKLKITLMGFDGHTIGKSRNIFLKLSEVEDVNKEYEQN